MTRERSARAPGPPSQRGGGRLVLLVDDIEDNREMYVQYLTFTGYRVAEADSGQDALVKAAALRPDVIVMDMSLPGMDGWEATRRLKKDPVTKKIPVVALTGHAFAGSDERAREAGCDGFLTKPCTPDELANKIDGLLADGRHGGETAR
ncbi:MAG TPA: response regulator [Vicinamibacteria bacterium]|nr:response regulator [Vicinamibacteria bacterium]